MSLFSRPPSLAGATFSEDMAHRYRCWRTWDEAKPKLGWLMLNPSTADGEELDPTLRRVQAFSNRDGFGGFEVWNLWPLRSTDPKGLWDWMSVATEADHDANRDAILAELPRFSDVVCAWGDFSKCPSKMRARAAEVATVVADTLRPHVKLWHLGLCSSGQPKHPLYLAGNTPRLPFGA